MEPRGTGPNVRLSVLCSRASPATSRVPASGRTEATLLTRRREACLGSCTATTSPGLGHGCRTQGTLTTTNRSPGCNAGDIEVPDTTTRWTDRRTATEARASAAPATRRRAGAAPQPGPVPRPGRAGSAVRRDRPGRRADLLVRPSANLGKVAGSCNMSQSVPDDLRPLPKQRSLVHAYRRPPAHHRRPAVPTPGGTRPLRPSLWCLRPGSGPHRGGVGQGHHREVQRL